MIVFLQVSKYQHIYHISNMWVDRDTPVLNHLAVIDPWTHLRTLGRGNRIIPAMKEPNIKFPSWWFQPIWKILVKLDDFPRDRGLNKNVWNHHLVSHRISAQDFQPGYVSLLIGEGILPQAKQKWHQQEILQKNLRPPNSRKPTHVWSYPSIYRGLVFRGVYILQTSGLLNIAMEDEHHPKTSER